MLPWRSRILVEAINMRFQLALNKTYCSIPPPLIDWRLKRSQTKIDIIILSASPSLVFDTEFTMPKLKSIKHSTLTVTENLLLVLESFNKISKLYASTDSEHKFDRGGIENLLPIGFKPIGWQSVVIITDYEPAARESPRLRTCSSNNNRGSLKILNTHS